MIDGMADCSDWDALATTFLGEGRNRFPCCSYAIFTDGTDFYAQNGTTGAIDYGGPDDNGTIDGGNARDVIQAAVDALYTNGGRICFRAGTYPLDAAINITTATNSYFFNLEFIGETPPTFREHYFGYSKTVVFEATTDGMTMFNLLGAGEGENRAFNVVFEDIFVDGKELANLLFDIDYFRYVWFNRVSMEHHKVGGYGIDMANKLTANSSCCQIFIQDCTFWDASLRFLHCDTIDIQRSQLPGGGILLDGTRIFWLEKSIGSSGFSITIDADQRDTAHIFIRDNDFELLTGTPLIFQSTSGTSVTRHAIISGNAFYNLAKPDYLIDMDYCEDIYIYANTFQTGNEINFTGTNNTTIHIEQNAWVSNVPTVNWNGNENNAIIPELWVPIWDDTHAQASKGNLGDHMAILLANNQDATFRFNFRVPNDFSALVDARVEVVCANVNPTLRWGIDTDICACGEAYNAHTNSIAVGDTELTQWEKECININAGFPPAMTALDNVGVLFTRNGAHANDDAGNVYVLGFVMRYI